ncbi:TPA: hypothetical protein RTV06_002719 [Staphylococcus aureus]|nr:hypothetical protein [Staphylococcus aureus]HDZ6149777.1 hypothetical protein [Staphylococcus aureus]
MNERTIETITNYYLDQKESMWKVFDVMATKDDDFVYVFLMTGKVQSSGPMSSYIIEKSPDELSKIDIKKAVNELSEAVC